MWSWLSHVRYCKGGPSTDWLCPAAEVNERDPVVGMLVDQCCGPMG